MVEAAAVLDRHGIGAAAARAALQAGAGVAPAAGGGARPRGAPTGRLTPRLRVALSCQRVGFGPLNLLAGAC